MIPKDAPSRNIEHISLVVIVVAAVSLVTTSF
jgi:hypothetical protein